MAEILNQPSSYFFFSDDVDPGNITSSFIKTVFVFEFHTTEKETLSMQRILLDEMLRECVAKVENWNTKQQQIYKNNNPIDDDGNKGVTSGSRVPTVGLRVVYGKVF